ncbi:MAG: hypothetical protein Q8R37_03210 [Nanoarchaeota archaeon]|nr:hypothetical protein [Nanoarchaeota archaeon]
MDPFSVTGIIIVILTLLFLDKILVFLSKFLYYAIVVLVVLIFLFGISFDQAFDLMGTILLWTF